MPEGPESHDLPSSPTSRKRRQKQERFHKHKETGASPLASPLLPPKTSSSPSTGPHSPSRDSLSYSPGSGLRPAPLHNLGLDNFALDSTGAAGDVDGDGVIEQGAQWRDDLPGEESVLFLAHESPRELGERIRRAREAALSTEQNTTVCPGDEQTGHAGSQPQSRKKKKKRKKKRGNRPSSNGRVDESNSENLHGSQTSSSTNTGPSSPYSVCRGGGLITEERREQTAARRNARLEKHVVGMLLSLLEPAADPVTVALKTLRKTRKALRQVK